MDEERETSSVIVDPNADYVWKRAQDVIAEHMWVLGRKRLQLVLQDDYGVENTGRWDVEVAYFIDRVLVPKLGLTKLKGAEILYRGEGPQGAARITLENLSGFIDDIAQLAIRNAKRSAEAPLDPIEYETYCASLLEERGWNTRLTQASGDQGVDVLATKGDIVIAIQCKRYAGAVGNDAVQQVFAGKKHYSAHFAAVVSNGIFSSSARQLAHSTGVLLLHHTQLFEIDQKLS